MNPFGNKRQKLKKTIETDIKQDKTDKIIKQDKLL